MAKPKKRKNNEPGTEQPQQASANPADGLSSLPNAATLLDEVQQRCESLRQWQKETQTSIQQRTEVVARREQELDEEQKRIEIARSRLELDQDAYKRAKLMFDKEKAAYEQGMQTLENEQARLERSRSELNEQRKEVHALREEMDEEWASLARIRRAQESLAAALDCERSRVQELKLDHGHDEEDESDQNADDSPGLSLAHAA